MADDNNDNTSNTETESANGTGTVNNEPRSNNRAKAKAGRKASVNNRRRKKRKKVGGPPLPKPIQEKLETGIEDITDELVGKIADMTVKPFKRLMSPAGVGDAIAAATKSPVAGMVVAGALSTTGSVVKGLGKFVQALQDELTLEQTKQSLSQGMSGGNTDILDALIELIHNDKLILNEAQLARYDNERKMLADLERTRELSKAEEERQKLLEQLVDTVAAFVPQKDKKQGVVGKAFDWVIDGLLKLLGFKYIAGKLLPLTGMGKMLAGAVGGGGLLSLIGTGIRTVFTFAFKQLPIMLLKGAGKILKGLSPLALINGIYEGIKGALQAWVDGGRWQDIIINALGSMVEGLTFGVISKDTFGKITDKIGELIFKAWEVFDNAWTMITSADYAGVWESVKTGAGDLLQKGWNWFTDSMSAKWEKEKEFWKEIYDKSGLKEKVEGWLVDIETLIKNTVAQLVDLWKNVLKFVETALNKIPFVDVALTDDSKRKKLVEDMHTIEKQIEDVSSRDTKEKGWFGTDVGSYTQERKDADLKWLKDQHEALQKKLKEEHGQTVAPLPAEPFNPTAEPINSPSKQKAIEAIVNQGNNVKAKSELSLQQSRPAYGPPAPQSNTVVSSQNTNNFVGPMSKRNNENTFVRAQDKNHPGRGM